MTKAPNQYEFESFLAELFTYGDKKELAAILDVSPSLVSQELNPHESEKKAKLFQGLRFLWAIYCLDEIKGEQVLARINMEAARWKRPSVTPAPSMAALTGNMTKEFSELVIALLQSHPKQKQLCEAVELKAALESVINGLMLDGCDPIEDCRSARRAK